MPVVWQIRGIFVDFGTPRKLHTDNGSEFDNEGMRHMLRTEFPDVEHIFGRPRHPQSQGLVEQANGVANDRIAKQLPAGKKSKNMLHCGWTFIRHST